MFTLRNIFIWLFITAIFTASLMLFGYVGMGNFFNKEVGWCGFFGFALGNIVALFVIAND